LVGNVRGLGWLKNMANSFVDTNIFLEVFVRKGAKSDKSKRLLENSDKLSTSLLVISEIEWVMRTAYEIERETIVRCLKKIFGLDIKIENREVLTKSLFFYKHYNVDWTDCVNMFLVKKAGISKVYSYDKGLNKFNWISRVEP